MRKLIAILFVGAFLYYAVFPALQELSAAVKIIDGKNNVTGTVGCLNK